MLLVCAAGVNLFSAEFLATGKVDAAGWVWLSEGSGKAQWRFYDLAWEGQYLSVGLLVQTRGWRTSPPPSLGVTLRFFTFCAALSRKMELNRVEEQGEFVAYFGQLILARRDLDVGGFLGVEVYLGPAGPECAVHPSSLRVQGERTVYAALAGTGGAGGPLVLAPTQVSPPTAQAPSPPAERSVVGFPSSGQTFRECIGREDAPFLSPGRYYGELGWPGPGQAVDAQDWLCLNLNAGHFVELRLFSPQSVSLRLLDPGGKEVGRVSGSGLIGITYQANTRGIYWVCISITQGLPSFTYTLDLSLRR